MSSPAVESSAAETAAPKSPSHLLAALSWVILLTVMFGGYALLGLLSRGELDPHHEQFFRAGHGHAGVLMAVAIIYANSLPRTGLGYTHQVIAWFAFLAGTLLLSGSFFLHMVIGTAGTGSLATNVMAPVGALVIAAAILVLAWRLFRFGGRHPVSR